MQATCVGCRRIDWRSRTLALALLALTLLLGVSLWRIVWAQGQLQAGRQALQRRDADAARFHLANYLRIWPGSASGHLLAARAARAAGAYHDAERHLVAAAAGDPAEVALEEYLLDAQRGTWSASAEWILRHKVEAADPEATLILEAMAAGYLQSYRLNEAMEALRRWLLLEPDCAQALYLRGLVWEGMQNLPKAREDYRLAIQAESDHVEAHRRLGEVLLSTRESREALEQFEHALGLKPRDYNLLLGKARCCRLLGETQEARRILDSLLQNQGDTFAVLNERGRIAAGEGEYAEGADYFQRAHVLDAYDSEVCYALAQCFRALGRAGEADRLLARGKKIDLDVALLQELHQQIGKRPTDAELRFQASQICSRNGQMAEAKRWLLSVLRLDPYHHLAREALATFRP